MKKLLLVWLAAAAFGQSPARKPVLGTVIGFQTDPLGIRVKPDSGEPQTITFSPDTIVQQIPPGEKDLKNAESIPVTAIAIDDRVLISFAGSEPEARRIVVMPAADIARRNEAEKQDWIQRGLAGVVAAKRGNEITLRMRTFLGESAAAVRVGETTRYRRYAPDSVKFTDAKPSSFAEIRVGDQLRTRGAKNADGKTVQAEEVVFGTFLTMAAAITAIHPESGEITAKELGGKKVFLVKLTVDSQVKKMPSFPGFGGRPGGLGPRSPGAGGPPGAQGPLDLAQMIERMPAAQLADLKTGETIVVSSTKGAKDGELTAIMLLANAEWLIQLATQQQEGRQVGFGSGGMNAGGGLGMGLGGLELPAMVP